MSSRVPTRKRRSPALPIPRNLVRRRHSLVVVLTFVTGCADATGFLALGGAFSSVMTGNMVLLGLAGGRADADLAINSGSAIVAYILGVLIGARVAGVVQKGEPTWPRAVSRTLLVELIVFLVFAAIWWTTSGHRAHWTQLLMLCIAACALGIQSSAVQRFGVSGLSSTYLTGTLTTVISGAAARKPWGELHPSIQVLGALIVGAATGSVVVEHAPLFSPALVIVPLVLVLIFSRTAFRTTTPEPELAD